MRGASWHAAAGMAAAADPSVAAGSTARLTGAEAVTLGVAAACFIAAQKLLPSKAAIDVPVALALAGLGIVIIIVPSAIPPPGAGYGADTADVGADPERQGGGATK